MRVAPLGNKQVFRGDAARVAYRKRIGLDGIANGAPDLDDGETPFQQRIRLVRKKFANPVRAGPFGVVVVNPVHRLAYMPAVPRFLIAGTQRVVEDMDPRGAGPLLHERFRFRIVYGLQFALIEEVRHRRGMIDELETVGFQAKIAQASIAHDDLVTRNGPRTASAHVACPHRLVHDLFACIDRVGHDRLDGGARFACLVHRIRSEDAPLAQRPFFLQMRKTPIFVGAPTGGRNESQAPPGGTAPNVVECTLAFCRQTAAKENARLYRNERIREFPRRRSGTARSPFAVIAKMPRTRCLVRVADGFRGRRGPAERPGRPPPCRSPNGRKRCPPPGANRPPDGPRRAIQALPSRNLPPSRVRGKTSGAVDRQGCSGFRL